MPIPDKHFLVITALGADRPGIVDTITQLVSQKDNKKERAFLLSLILYVYHATFRWLERYRTIRSVVAH